MVLYEYDSNAIISEPLKYRREHKLMRAYTTLHTKLTNQGLQPNFQTLDNKCPSGLNTFMRKEGVTFQLSPTHLDRTKADKRAIQTFKDHLFAGISSCNPNFRLHLWDRLLLQATLTLHLLHPSQINPGLYAEAQLNVIFEFNQTPLAPPRNTSPRV